MSKVSVVGVGMAKFGRFPETPLTAMGVEAVLKALADAEGARPRIEAVYVGSGSGGSMIGQRVTRQTGLPEVPVVNFENACSSGSTAFHHAVRAIAAGLHETILVLGLDKLSFTGGTLPRHPDDYEGSLGQSAPGLYAMRAQRYLRDFGGKPEDLALVSVKNRRHALHNEDALFRSEVTIKEVMASRMVCEPLTLLQCCARSDGAAATVVTSTSAAKNYARKPIHIRASMLCSGRYLPGFRDMTSPEISVRGAKIAYEEAGLGPDDVDFAEVHDAFSIAEVLYYEALGFCGHGEGIATLRRGDTALGGRIPVNVSGGLVSKGHPPGATGTAQIVEAVMQLRGEAGARQVERARIGLTHCTGGGVSGLDHGACTIHVLSS